jgi:hypothetical protein
VSDEQYEVLKRSVRRRGEDRKDVTALLLYTKGVQLLEPEQYEALRDEMTKLGIEVGLKGATCTLSKTSESIKVRTFPPSIKVAGWRERHLSAAPRLHSSPATGKCMPLRLRCALCSIGRGHASAAPTRRPQAARGPKKLLVSLDLGVIEHWQHGPLTLWAARPWATHLY